MVLSLAATRFDFSNHGRNVPAAIKEANNQFTHSVPLIKAMIQEIDNRMLMSAGGTPTQSSGLEHYYVASFTEEGKEAEVTDPSGYAASPHVAAAVRAIDAAQNSTGFGAQIASFATTAAITAANPLAGALHGLYSAATDSFGGTPLERLRDKLQVNLDIHEQNQRAIVARGGLAVSSGTKDSDMGAPRFEGYRTVDHAPKIGVMPAPAMA